MRHSNKASVAVITAIWVVSSVCHNMFRKISVSDKAFVTAFDGTMISFFIVSLSMVLEGFLVEKGFRTVGI